MCTCHCDFELFPELFRLEFDKSVKGHDHMEIKDGVVHWNRILSDQPRIKSQSINNFFELYIVRIHVDMVEIKQQCSFIVELYYEALRGNSRGFFLQVSLHTHPVGFEHKTLPSSILSYGGKKVPLSQISFPTLGRILIIGNPLKRR